MTPNIPATLFPVAIVWRWVPLYTLIHILVFALVVFHCLKTRREPTSAILWIFVAWAFPVLGALFYLSFGINRIDAKAWLKQQADRELLEKRQVYTATEEPPLVYWEAVHTGGTATLPKTLANQSNETMDAVLTDYPLLAGNAVQLLINGDEAYPAMLQAIESAEQHIHLQSFIIGNDCVGRRFLDALAEKAQEGVRVRVLFDRFGSTHAVLGGLFRKYRKVPNMQLIGWTQANPVKRQFQINLRNHRKVLVVDGKTAFAGGINISDINTTDPGPLEVLDYHFALSGPIVQELQYSFLKDWYFMTDEKPGDLLTKAHFPAVDNAGQAYVRVVNSSPTNTEMGIVTDVFFSGIVSARKDLIILTPYFVPGPDILQALRATALRGVRVQLIVPKRNNHFYAGLAGKALYEELLAAGVTIYERKPPFIHAKAFVVDDTLAIIGTANFDHRSLRLNYETNLAVYDQSFMYNVKRALNAEIENSTPIDLATWRERPLHHRLAQNLCNLMTPIL
ncbi:MAG: cardiolipin synthase [Candidatus Pacebacteria bacterium]|nr:cardiolipin synthase [Candidatus Paceibacterota bacterium]